MLSTRFKDKFNCCRSDGSYDFNAYAAWWDSVARVDVGEVRLIRQTDGNATVYAELSYLMKSGDHIADDQPYIQLVFDPATHGWLFDDKGVNP
jgi:hypothetical protein